MSLEQASLLFTGITALAAIFGPLVLRSDVRKQMAVSWGAAQATIQSHGERLNKAETKLDDHGQRIAKIEGICEQRAGECGD